MKRQHLGWIGGFALLLAGVAVAQTTPAPLLQHTFDEDANGWTAIGSNAKISTAHEAANVKQGKGSLQFDYDVGKDGMNLLLLMTPENKLAKMKSLHFWIKTSHSVPIVLGLQEKGGGRYYAAFSTPVEQWQRVELAPSDFSLAVGADDPKDPDNKLDLDQIGAVALVDLSQLFAASDNADFVKMLSIQTGAHRLYLDDFVVSEEALPDATADKSELKLDNLARPQIGWMALGDVSLSHANGKPLEGTSLQADYHQGPQKLIGLIKGVQRGKLANASELGFTAASSKPTHLIVQVEESGGGKYNTSVSLPGNSERKEFKLAFSDFKATDDSKDSNGHLDLDQVFQIIIMDMSGLLDKADQDNSLWLNDLHVTVMK